MYFFQFWKLKYIGSENTNYEFFERLRLVSERLEEHGVQNILFTHIDLKAISVSMYILKIFFPQHFSYALWTWPLLLTPHWNIAFSCSLAFIRSETMLDTRLLSVKESGFDSIPSIHVGTLPWRKELDAKWELEGVREEIHSEAPQEQPEHSRKSLQYELGDIPWKLCL